MMSLFYFRKRSSTLLRLGMLLPCLMYALTGHTQTTMVQVGTGSGTSGNIPITAYYGYSYSQQIYTAADLQTAGALPGANIQKIRFYLASGPAITNNSSWAIYIGNSSKTEFISNTDWVPVANLTQVFNGNVTFPANGNWMEITLTAPIAWNGVGSLVVAVDENTPGYASSNVLWNTTGTGQNRSIYYYNDNTNPDPASPPSATARNNNVSNVQFDFVQTPCNGTPAPGATLASAAVLCSGGSSLLTLQNNYGANSGIGYQWQSSANGTTGWQNINGATSLYYTAAPGATTWYRAQLTCGTNTGSSAPVSIAVNPLPNVTVSSSNIIYCTGSPAAITASGANSYSWSPAANLSADTGATVQAAPTAPQLYTVTGTDNNGCKDTATVKVASIRTFRPVAAISPAVSCSTGTPVTVAVSNAPAQAGIEYQLSDTAGNVIGPWQSGAAFTFTPSAPGNLKYVLNARLSGCSPITDTSAVNVYYGFAADVRMLSGCSGAGSLVVSKPQGANLSTDNWQRNFDVPALPAGDVLYGSASITGGRMVITPAASSLKGALGITGLSSLNPRTVALDFLLTADQPVNNFGTGGADGIAWSFGDDANFSNSITNGAGSKLRLVFDAANNGTENGNVTGIYLTYGYASNTQMGPGSAGVLAYSSNMSWKVQTDKPVRVVIDEESKLTMTYDGSVIFDHIQLPQAYISADKSQWKHLFTAFTGGDALRFAIDELNIKYTRQDFVYGISPGGSGQVPATWQAADTFANLVTPDSFDVWIASASAPASCNKRLGTYLFRYPVAITNISHTGLSTCGANDGSIKLEGLVPNITYGLAYTIDSTQNITATVTSDTLGHIMINNLAPGHYSAIAVSLDSCTSALAGPVTIPQIVKPLITAVISDTNSECAIPNGAIKLSSPGFVNGYSYDIWYNGAAHGSILADSTQQMIIPGLSGGSYSQLYIVAPQACHSDTVGAITVGGKLPPPVITNVSLLAAPGCVGANGILRLSGTFNPGTTQVIFRRNGIWSSAAVTQNAAGLTLSNLAPGVYDSMQVPGSCPSNSWTPVTLSGAASPISIAAASATHSDIQGAGVAVDYTSSSCELIASLSSGSDSLGNVTIQVGVLDSTMVQGGQPYVGRYYDISAGNNAGGTVTLYFKDAEFNHYNAKVAAMGNSQFPAIGPAGEHLQISAFHAKGAGNGPQGYDNTRDVEVIMPLMIVHNTVSGFWEVMIHTDSFSGFFAHTNLNGSPLPVRLAEIAAVNLGDVNRIDWQTAQEAAGDRFVVERSEDGRQFKAIGAVAARGVSGSAYQLIDNEPVNGLNYYRVKILNNDGSSFYSKVVYARVDNSQLLITTIPNPVHDELTVSLRGSVAGGALLLTDATGRMIDRRNVNGDGHAIFSMKQLTPGMYLLTYRQGSINRTIKVIKH